ncbi:MAG TPA: hypothetical protein VII84_07660 [Acidimicrobiales bacterium]
MPTLTARSASVQMHPAAVSVVGLQLYHFETLFEHHRVGRSTAFSPSILRPPYEEYDFLK